MSNTQQDQDTYDFWEFVSCSKCRMPFALESGVATVPFWLTECGHVMCNNHINSDQSCGQCGSQGIQVTPLHREVEAPMSEWFRSIPSALENIAYAAKFQQDAMASQLRYHRTRHQQLRQILEKLKREMSELKRENEALRNQNEQNQAYADEPAYNLNQNGKRQMLNNHYNDPRRPITGSSARSVPTPLGPNRLTLQPGQPLHELSSNKHSDPQRPVQSQDNYMQQRPTSTRSLEKYAYTPHDNNSYHAPHLTHAQAAPRYFQVASQQDTNPQQSQPQTRRSNPAPPPSSRFKPAPTQNLGGGSGSIPQLQAKMGPPPVPRQRQNDGLPLPNVNGNVNGNPRASMQHTSGERALQPPHLMSRRESLVPGTPAPPVKPHPTPRRFFPSTRGQSRPSMPAEGQRRPFFPI